MSSTKTIGLHKVTEMTKMLNASCGDQGQLALLAKTAVNSTVDIVARSACRIDGKKHGDIDKYYQANIFQYVVATATWIGILNDVLDDSKVTYEFLAQIRAHGLADVIDACKSASEWLLRNEQEATPITYQTACYSGFGWLAPILTKWEYGNKRDLLIVLRFLARFTAAEATANIEAKLSDFVGINNNLPTIIKCSERNSTDAPSFSNDPEKLRGYWVLVRLRSYFSTWNLGDLPDCIIPGEFVWSDGSCLDGATVKEKLYAFALREPNLGGSPLYPLSNNNKGPMRVNKIKVQPVPKNYKSPRLIFPQGSYACSYLHQMRKLLQMRLASMTPIDLSDQQSINRDACMSSSVDSMCATIDHSDASDRIAWMYYEFIFPSRFISWLYNYREGRLQVGGKTIFNNIAFTAGNPVTFVLETMFYYALADIATDITGAFLSAPERYKNGRIKKHKLVHMKAAQVYGDDVIIDTRAVDTYLTMCDALGLKVNMSKSYWSGPFRESCGFECLSGQRIDGYYWPRRIVGEGTKVEDSFILTSLYNRLEAPSAKWFLEKVIHMLNPRMTWQIGNQYSDLTGYNVPAKVMAPGAEKTNKDISELEESMLREKHMTPCLRYAPYEDDPMIEMLLYYEFLKRGPYYEDDLLRSLNVSSPRFTREALCDSGVPAQQEIHC